MSSTEKTNRTEAEAGAPGAHSSNNQEGKAKKKLGLGRASRKPSPLSGSQAAAASSGDPCGNSTSKPGLSRFRLKKKSAPATSPGAFQASNTPNPTAGNNWSRGLASNRNAAKASTSTTTTTTTAPVGMPTLRGITKNAPPVSSASNTPYPTAGKQWSRGLASNSKAAKTSNSTTTTTHQGRNSAPVGMPTLRGIGKNAPRASSNNQDQSQMTESGREEQSGSSLPPSAPEGQTGSIHVQTNGDDEVAVPSTTMTNSRPANTVPSLPLDNLGLVEALPVTGESSRLNLTQAIQVDPDTIDQRRIQQGKRKQCRRIGYLIVAICIVVVGTAIGVSLGTQKKETAKAAPILEHLFLILPPSTQEIIQNDPNGDESRLYQSQAYKWVLDDPDFDTYSDSRLLQRFALATLYYATNGTNWKSRPHSHAWQEYGTHECNWTTSRYRGNSGVVCGSDNKTSVQELKLQQSGMEGGIPNELGMLTSLRRLDLWSNQLTATVPTELALLTNLSVLTLWSNQLTGTVPTELGLLTKLSVLYLESNPLTGTVPTELGLLTNLSELHLGINQLTGTLPTELGRLTNLSVFLFLRSNQLTGTLPTELGRLTNLSMVQLGRNQLTGTVPTELGLIANLTELYLWGNQLTGTVPTELGLLTKLRKLHLGSNQLAGTLFTELGLLMDLLVLGFGSSQLTGTLPTELGLLTNLVALYLYDNQFTGTIPTEFGLLTNLVELVFANTTLIGTVPPFFVRFHFRFLFRYLCLWLWLQLRLLSPQELFGVFHKHAVSNQNITGAGRGGARRLQACKGKRYWKHLGARQNAGWKFRMF